MTHSPPPELFAERPVSSDFGEDPKPPRSRSKWVALGAVILVLAGGASLFLASSGSDEPAGEPPVITAEGPLRELPESPGGIEIPHQNEMVFGQIDGKQEAPSDPAVEHLLPPPERPQAANMAPPAPLPVPQVQLPPPMAVAAPPQPMLVPSPSAVMPATTPHAVQAPKPAQQQVAPAAKPTPVPTPAAKIAEKPSGKTGISVAPLTDKPVAKTAQAAQAAPRSLVVGTPPKDLAVGKGAGATAIVQLASYPDSKIAEGERTRLQAKYAQSLEGAALRVVRAEVPGKGVYFRVQSGPLPESAAKNVCSSLWARKAACILLRP